MAQISITIRRWGVFWGVVRPEPGEEADTLISRIRNALRQPWLKTAFISLAAFEVLALGSWTYFAHGSHLYRLGDEAVGRLTGNRVIYTAVCDGEGRGSFVRLVLDGGNGPFRRTHLAPVT